MFIIKRIYKKDRTLGQLFLDEQPLPYQTLELPDKDNVQFTSCIPEGTYKLVKWKSPKFKDCLKVLDVPNRTDILIHAGNDVNNTTGCILIGELVKDKLANSKKCLKEFLELCSDNNELKIQYFYE